MDVWQNLVIFLVFSLFLINAPCDVYGYYTAFLWSFLPLKWTKLRQPSPGWAAKWISDCCVRFIVLYCKKKDVSYKKVLLKEV